MGRVARIGIAFVVGVAYTALVSWLWSRTPEPNDASEGFTSIVDLLVVASIVACIIAGIRKEKSELAGS